LVGYLIIDYIMEGKTLKGVKLSNKVEALQISCSLVVCLHQKHVDPQAFRAMNHACLVFDSRLVVDTCYRTNDPNIFAAGPVTKYSRRYHTEWYVCVTKCMYHHECICKYTWCHHAHVETCVTISVPV